MDRFVLPVLRAPRTSRMAISSLLLGISSFLCWIFTGLPAVVLGVVALVRINRSNGALRGTGLAIGGIVSGGVSIVLLLPIIVAVVLPLVDAYREAGRRNVAMKSMLEIVTAMHEYARQHGAFPAPGGGTGINSQLSWRVRLLPYLGQ